MIRFPVIRRLDIRGYQLFQNDKSNGIAHDFNRGVHVVVGINSIGKTTLLVLLYRALLGPFDQHKSDEVGLLGSQHSLSAWRSKRYFQSRVRDGAIKATIEIDVSFGDRVLTIRRRIRDLKIVFLAVNGQEYETTQDNYEALILELSGVATFFDFFAILKYLAFYLEERTELIWDRRSQFDMFRILLFDTHAAAAASKAYDEVQAADSRYRNRRAIVGNDRNNLTDLEAKAGYAQTIEFRALQAVVAKGEERDTEQSAKIEETKQLLETTRLSREKALLDLQEAQYALELEEQAHYRRLFPDLKETAEYVFLGLLGGSGCLVCGTTDSNVADHLREKLEAHLCPICNSPAVRHEKVTTSADFSRARLRTLKGKVDQLRSAVRVASEEIDLYEAAHRQLLERREQDRAEWLAKRSELALLGPIDIPDDSELESLRAAVKEGERELASLKETQNEAESVYRRILQRQQGNIDSATKTIRRLFRQFASVVLAERCDLSIKSDYRSIGQEGEKFRFPYFEVMMTSGVFDQSLSSRENADAVSESQREFLDIAFRLALIEAVAGASTDSMIVLETPESSLDSLFIAKAGEVFRRYAENPRRKNVLIASTNLNNEQMLPALLGTQRAPTRSRMTRSQVEMRPANQSTQLAAPPIPKAQRSSRVINLLDLAAPNAALRQYRGHYTRLLRRALGGPQ